MIGLKVIMGDPARKSDAFAWVGAQMKLSDYKIEFKLAKQFFNTPYKDVAAYGKMIHKKIRPNFMGIELNRNGKKVLQLFKQKYKMDWMQGVNTSSGMTEKSRNLGYTMDKNFMVEWFSEKLKDHEILFPTIPSVDMQEFINQIPKITQYKTLAGATTYKAHRGQHDDLFMAGLHCCNVIRLFINQQERLK